MWLTSWVTQSLGASLTSCMKWQQGAWEWRLGHAEEAAHPGQLVWVRFLAPTRVLHLHSQQHRYSWGQRWGQQLPQVRFARHLATGGRTSGTGSLSGFCWSLWPRPTERWGEGQGAGPHILPGGRWGRPETHLLLPKVIWRDKLEGIIYPSVYFFEACLT